MSHRKTVKGHVHPAHELKLAKLEGRPYRCHTCKEQGTGQRFQCWPCNLDFHWDCATAPAMVPHPLCQELCPLQYLSEGELPGQRPCQACRRDICGSLYCNEQNQSFFHPCCARLPMMIEEEGLKMRLFAGAATPAGTRCSICTRGLGRAWSYRFETSGLHMHVLCVLAAFRYAINLKRECSTKAQRWRRFAMKSLLFVIKQTALFALYNLVGDACDPAVDALHEFIKDESASVP